ncbi:MAG: phosphate-starvation-inducible PsiE family protein [Nitrospira sp.]|nr:phosphate-starvation-inducible PsiE family protein [Nitrospira sp.]
MDERHQGRPSLLILTILIAMPSGVIKTFLDIRLLFDMPVEIGLCQISVDTLILLAVVEVFKTTLTYFSEGRVNVTFLGDTILVVMLTEINLLGFKDADHMKVLLLGAIRLSLGAIRVVAVRCSPAHGEGNGGGCRRTR